MGNTTFGVPCVGLPEGSYVFHDLMMPVRILLNIAKTKKLTGYAILVRKDLRKEQCLGVVFLQEGSPYLVRSQENTIHDNDADLPALEQSADVWVLDIHLLPKETIERVRKQLQLNRRDDVLDDFESRDIVVQN